MPRRFDFVSPGIQLTEVDQSQLPVTTTNEPGPLIVGRALAGPAMKPIRVKTLEDFNEVFGIGIAGKGGSDNDIWREGNTLGPTYGIYAAQAHLASNTTPVTFVRLLGEHNSEANSNAEYAGWAIDNSAAPNRAPTHNAAAYGLFVFGETSANKATGSLAAIFYVTGAALALYGNKAGTGVATASAGTLIDSLGGSVAKFKMYLYNTENPAVGETPAEEFTFNFTPGTSNYIRDQFNTNPQLLKANKNFGLTNKSYFLGETFEESVRSVAGTDTTAGKQTAILLALNSGSLDYGHQKKQATAAKTGWFINRKTAQNQTPDKLFRLVAIHEGEWIQNNYKVNIKDLVLGNSLVPNSKFTVEICDKNNNVVEQFSNLTLDPGSENYISKVIGDQYLAWDSTNLKYNVRGEYLNNSNYVYVEVTTKVAKQELNDRHALPVGCHGPLRPKGFTLIQGSSGPNTHNDDEDNKTQATATLTIDDSRKIQTGTGMVVSAGIDEANGGIHVSNNVRTDLDADTLTITFGAVDAAIKGANGTSLASTAIEIVMKNEADVSGETVGANQIMISCNKNNNTANYDSVAHVATAIAAVINGDQNNAILTVDGARTFNQSVKFGSNVSGLLATPTNGGDPDSVFVATVVNTSGVKLQLRGSQGVDSGTNAANFGAYGGAWASTTSHVKIASSGTLLANSTSDQTTVTAGDATDATTITVTIAGGSPVTKTANVDFFVDGNDNDATAITNTVTDLAAALNAISGIAAAGSSATTVTLTHDVAGTTGNTAVLAFANGASGTFTNQGNANDASELFTGGLDNTDDFFHAFVEGNATIPLGGGDATTFAHLPTSFVGSVKFPSLRLTDVNSNSNGKNYPPTALFGVRHHRGTSTRRDDSYIDLVRSLPSDASHTLKHHYGENDSIPDALEYSYIFSLDDIFQDTNNTSTYYYKSGSYDEVSAGDQSYSQKNGLGGTNGLFTKKIRQFQVPLFGGFDGLDITEVEPFSNTNLTDKTRVNSYAYNSVFKALETISDPEVVTYDLISLPGVTNTDVTDEVLSLVSDRQDALAIIDIPSGYQPGYENNGSSVAGSIDGTINNLEGRVINNSYAATYYPWVRLRDRVGGQNDVLYVPPSVAAIGALGKSQGLSELWFAPAGFNRGGINELGGPKGPIITGTWEHLTKDDRDKLYAANINPIARFPSLDQIVIFGQKTLQQTPSALDRINVRRLMIHLKYRIGLIANTILFDQNVRTTWNRFKFQASAVLNDIQGRLGIVEYKLELDEKTTTADLVDRNIMYAKIFIKPARSIEFIAVDFVITRSGVEF